MRFNPFAILRHRRGVETLPQIETGTPLPPPPSVVDAVAATTPEPAPATRNYAAAHFGNLLGDWITSNSTGDRELTYSLETLRARARDFARNNPYFQRFLRLLEINVIGADGINLQSRVIDDNGTPDVGANKQIDAAWYSWGRYGNCTTCGQYSLQDVLGIVIKSVARDGEIFLRQYKGFRNRHRYALQLLEADYCPTTYNATYHDNEIRNGIEYDTYGAIVAYWLYETHPGADPLTTHTQNLRRVPAEQIIHIFVRERPSQGRGIPWIAAAAMQLRHLDKFVEAELVATRAGAAQAGWIISPTGGEYRGDGESDGLVTMEVQPGVYRQLPRGVDVREHTPTHPNVNTTDFSKLILRAVSVALGVSYNSLNSDLESVNYSSLRQGALEDRDAWRLLQTLLITRMLERIFPAWLETQMLAGIINLPLAKLDKFNSPWFYGRPFAWVDPVKDVTAAKMELESGLKSRTMILAERGISFEDVCQDLAREREIMTLYGITDADVISAAFSKAIHAAPVVNGETTC